MRAAIISTLLANPVDHMQKQRSNPLEMLTERAGWPVVAAFAAVIAFAGVWTLPPLDRDEARFAQATVQMMESGDFVSIRFQDNERNKKPAGIHWLQAASVSVFSDREARAIWAYRLPSVAGGVLAAIFTYFAAARLYDRRTGLFAGLLLAAAPLAAAESTIAKTDAMLLALVCLAQLAFIYALAPPIQATEARLPEANKAAAHNRRRTALSWPTLFWLAQGAAILVKGPIGPMVSLLTGAGLAARQPRLSWIKRLRPVTGMALTTLIVAPWGLAIGLATEGRFFIEAVGGDMLGKIGAAQEQHGAPPGYHAGLVPVLFWPAAALILPGLLELWRTRRTWQALFVFAWLIPAWAVFELSATKLPHYVLPLYPALAIIAARAITAPPGNRSLLLQKTGAAVYGLVGLGAAALIIALPAFYGFGPVAPLAYAGAALTALAALAIASLFWRGRRANGALAATLLAGLYAWLLMGAIMPGLSKLAVSPQLSQTLEEAGRHPLRAPVTDDASLSMAPAPAALVGYNEPSAVFLLGTATRLTSADAAARDLLDAGVSTAIVEQRHQQEFENNLGQRTGEIAALAVVDGLNYSNGQDVSLTVYVRRETIATQADN